MKIIVAKSEIDAAGKTLGFGAAHAFEQFGALDAATGNREFDFEVLTRIMRSYTGKQPAPEPMIPPKKFTPPTEEQVAAWLIICAACPFVLKADVLKCGHERQTCATCSQGKSGLTAALKTFSFVCPERKLKS